MPVNGRLHLNWNPPQPRPAGAGGGRPPRGPEAWAARYVGLPFKEHGRDRSGADCWGLVRLALSEVFGCETESFDAGYVGCGRADAAAIGGLIAKGKAGWQPVAEAAYWIDQQERRPAPPAPNMPPDYFLCPLGAERPGDCLLIRQHGEPCHIGLVAGGGYMLHTEEGVNAVVVPYVDRDWRRRIVGIYRHPQLVA